MVVLEKTAGGKMNSVPVYYNGQNCDGVPDHYVSSGMARLLKSRGKARSINRGKAILVEGPRPLKESTRESVKDRWKVVGQTAKNGLYPGVPRWNLV